MSCPICGTVCRCAEPRAYETSVTLADPDPYDDTEEQFASSVAGLVQREPNEEEQELASGSLAAARERYRTLRPPMNEPDLPSSTAFNQEPEAWRDEIHSRVQNYKARRRRGINDDTLSFNFESTAGNHVFLRPEHEPEPEPLYSEPEPAPSYVHSATAPVLEEPAESFTEPSAELNHAAEIQQSFAEFIQPELKPAQETAKLIVFPRPPIMVEPRRDELAEPVFDTPRILDAPEAVETVAIPLADITLQPELPEDQCVPHAEPELELPYRVAPMAQRIAAEIVDTLLVGVATGIFGLIIARLNAALLLHEKRALVGMLIVPAIFWIAYKYLFLVYDRATLGMRMMRLQLVDFHGVRARQPIRRVRALSMVVSIFPLALGLLWSFVDQDTLCWHDRISRTYMTRR